MPSRQIFLLLVLRVAYHHHQRKAHVFHSNVYKMHRLSNVPVKDCRGSGGRDVREA